MFLLANKSKNFEKVDRKKLFNLLNIMDIPEDIEQIKNLPILALKGMNAQTNHIISQVLDVVTIKELANATISAYHKKQFRKYGIPSSNLDKWIAAAKIINNIDRIEKKYVKKIVFMGLDNAGKTSIINLLTKKIGIETFGSLKPTEGVVRHELIGMTLDYIIWDFGGQELYRKTYLSKPEKFFVDLDLFFYVIDIQDRDRIIESFNYFKKVVEILKYLNEKPYFNILIHKYDPNLKKNPKYLQLINQVQALFSQVLSGFEYEFFTTSIYNSLPSSDKLVGDIQLFLKSGLKNQEFAKFNEIIQIVENIMSLVIRFSIKIEETQKNILNRLNILENRIGFIESTKSPNSIINTTQTKTDSLIQNNLTSEITDTQESFSDDLKNIIKKKLADSS